MVRITRVYTRKGDRGTTSLVGKQRFAKTSPRIVAIGEIDELNACLGFAAQIPYTELEQLKQNLFRIQNELFELGAQLATLSKQKNPHIKSKDIQRLEKEIDAMNSDLSPLSSFVLPGGHELSARLHLARTVCRRVERSVVALSLNEKMVGKEIPYLNRLSDWLFVAARFVNHRLGEQEQLWMPREKK